MQEPAARAPEVTGRTAVKGLGGLVGALLQLLVVGGLLDNVQDLDVQLQEVEQLDGRLLSPLPRACGQFISAWRSVCLLCHA